MTEDRMGSLSAIRLHWSESIVEGIVDHQFLGIHHVNETVPRPQWIYGDMAFLAWGLQCS